MQGEALEEDTSQAVKAACSARATLRSWQVVLDGSDLRPVVGVGSASD
jgi:hypothetical protein